MTQPLTQYDIIVVGCGAAGLSAALSYAYAAREPGRISHIAVLESAAQEERGGATRWTTAGMRASRSRGLDSSWIGLVNEASKGLVDNDYCRRLEQEVPNTLEFLEEHGVELIEQAMHLASSFSTVILPNGGGHAIVDALAKALGQIPGAEILYQTEAVRLSLSEDGRVDGVLCRGNDGLLKTLHAPAVVLACGGFEGSKEMLTRYLGKDACDLKLIAPGIGYNRGSGIRMAMEIGADTAGQFDMIHSELVDPRSDLPDAVILPHPYGIVVNDAGLRFYDEGNNTIDMTFELIAFEVWKNQKQTAIFIADAHIRGNAFIEPLFMTDQPPIEADTIEDLARQIGLEPEVLVSTVAIYNDAVGPGKFDPLHLDGKSTIGLIPPKSNWAYPIDKPPYFAYPVTTAITFTYGGLRTDCDARVLSAYGVPIPGLYAAGEIVGLFYHEYQGGLSVLKALTFGRLAGTHAAKNVFNPNSFL